MFSLVLCTINRPRELERFIDSLARQTEPYELIIVDQNQDDSTAKILQAHKLTGTVHHLRHQPMGLSKARNIGLQKISGDIVAFPDDDCWYPDGLLTDIQRIFDEQTEYDLITCQTRDENMQPSIGMFLDHDADITVRNILSAGNSNGIFVRRRAQSAVATFDENLGVGSQTKFGAGEEADFILRVLAAGYKGRFISTLHVHHPEVQLDSGRALDRAKKYAPGLGLLFRRHNFPAATVGWRILKPFLGGLVYAATLQWAKAQYKLTWSRGLLQGYFSQEASR